MEVLCWWCWRGWWRLCLCSWCTSLDALYLVRVSISCVRQVSQLLFIASLSSRSYKQTTDVAVGEEEVVVMAVVVVEVVDTLVGCRGGGSNGGKERSLETARKVRGGRGGGRGSGGGGEVALWWWRRCWCWVAMVVAAAVATAAAGTLVVVVGAETKPVARLVAAAGEPVVRGRQLLQRPVSRSVAES